MPLAFLCLARVLSTEDFIPTSDETPRSLTSSMRMAIDHSIIL